MKAKDVMTRTVISAKPETSVAEMAKLMMDNRISGLPIIDKNGKLVGIVTEGDFLRRTEIGTERKRPRWLDFFTGPGRLANEYVHSHGRKAAEIMTEEPVTITEETPLEEAVHLMEQHRIKRLPVLRGDAVVGIVSRANLLYALASIAAEVPAGPSTDTQIRDRLMEEFATHPWASLLNVTVRNGVVQLWGAVLAAHEREAAIVMAENVPGVKAVHSRLAWVEPVSGMVFDYPEDDATAAWDRRSSSSASVGRR